MTFNRDGKNTAWKLPKFYRGVPVIDADASDLRFLEPRGIYCGLRAKGHAKIDKTGFVHDVYPSKEN